MVRFLLRRQRAFSIVNEGCFPVVMDLGQFVKNILKVGRIK